MIRVNGTYPINVEIESVNFTVYSHGAKTIVNFQLDSKEAEILMKRLNSQLKQIEHDIQLRWKYQTVQIPRKEAIKDVEKMTPSFVKEKINMAPRDEEHSLRDELGLEDVDELNGIVPADEDPFNRMI